MEHSLYVGFRLGPPPEDLELLLGRGLTLGSGREKERSFSMGVGLAAVRLVILG